VSASAVEEVISDRYLSTHGHRKCGCGHALSYHVYWRDKATYNLGVCDANGRKCPCTKYWYLSKE